MDRHPRKPPTRPLVLVGNDDDDDTRELYAQRFVFFGLEAIRAGDCGEVHRRAWEFHPNTVVTDQTLRDGDGRQLVQALSASRERDAYRPAYSPATLLHRCENARRIRAVPAYFVKPCLPDELATDVRQRTR